MQETYFAPTERTAIQDIQKFTSSITSHPDFLLIAEKMPEPFVLLDKHRQIVFANRAFLNLLNLESPELIQGLRVGEAFGCLRAKVMEAGCGTSEYCATCGAVNAILTGLKGTENQQECRIILADGVTSLDLEVKASPMNGNGSQMVLFFVKDVSDKKRRSALDRIFFHDILNTAGGLKGVFDVLSFTTPEEKDELLKMGAGISETLLDEILAQKDLSAAENNELSVSKTEIDSLELLQQVYGVYSKHPVSRNKSLKLDPHTVSINIQSDKTLLKRVLGNLVKNALEASKTGDVVTLGALKVKGEITYWVHNPAFIPRNIQLQIFQRSFSTKGSGRGLGTYSINLLTTKYLGGRVTFVSDENTGTIFRIILPV